MISSKDIFLESRREIYYNNLFNKVLNSNGVPPKGLTEIETKELNEKFYKKNLHK